MSTVNEIRFGDVVRLQTKSAFVESATPSTLSFLELPGKTQTQLLVVPPVKDEVKDRLVDAEFIIAPIRGEKQQPNGTPLTFQTPFVLRTSDGKDGSTYSLNNKVAGQREAISLQIAATKGEMYIQVEKEGSTKVTGLHYGTDGLNLRVVDSNRVRKTLNQLITHTVKPKSDTLGGMVTCGAKGAPLTFSFQRVVDAEGNPLTETRMYIKNPQARRASMEGISPSKMSQLGRAERIDSSEFSDMSRSSSVAGLNSNPASPRGVPGANGFATPVDAAAVAARLPSSSASGDSSTDNSSAETKTSAAKHAVVDAKSSVPTPSPPVKAASVKIEIAKIEAAKAEAAKAEPVKVGTATTGAAKTDPVKTTPPQPEPKTSTPPLAPVATAATTPSKATPAEPKTVLADASTFPPTPLIYGPAPAPVVLSPKASTSPKPTVKAGATPTTTPASPKMLKEEEVARLKAEAEVENLQPACGAKCSVM